MKDSSTFYSFGSCLSEANYWWFHHFVFFLRTNPQFWFWPHLSLPTELQEQPVLASQPHIYRFRVSTRVGRSAQQNPAQLLIKVSPELVHKNNPRQKCKSSPILSENGGPGNTGQHMLSTIYIFTSEDFASAAVKLGIFQICSALLRRWVVLLIFCRLKQMTGNVNENWGGELTAASEISHCKRLFITEFYGEFPESGRALGSFIPIGWVTSENVK